jgi:hypothetical protein
MRVATRRTMGVALLAMCCVGWAYCEADKSITVCEALSNIEHYQGKIVTLQGVFVYNSRHGWLLADNSSFRACPSLEKRGITWPPAMYLTNTPQYQEKASELAKSVAGHDDLMIVATLTGELRSKANMHIHQIENGAWIGFGYGDGSYPAEFAIKDMKEIKVVKKQ